MKARQLLVQLLVLLAVLAAANGAVAVLSRQSGARQRLRSIEASPPADVLFLGNSLVDAGVDGGAFESAWPGRHGLNLGLGASSPVAHVILLKRAGRHGRARDVVYGFWATQLTDPVPDDWSDLAGNRAVAYYVDTEEAIALSAPDSPFRAWQMRLLSRVPLLAERQTIWARVERLRRRLGRVGLPPEETNRFGRAADFAALEPPDPLEFAGQCRQSAEDGVPFSAPVQALFRIAGARGARVLLVEMPMPSGYRRRFCDTPGWLLYRRHLRELARKEGGAYLSAVDWVGDEHFRDVLHLDPTGAALFSKRLAEEMSAMEAKAVAPGQGGDH
jgi:hypothetical protein